MDAAGYFFEGFKVKLRIIKPMKKDIEQQIDRLREEVIPPCPGNFEANVLRRIRLNEAPERAEGWLGWLDGCISRTGFVATAMTLVIVLSAVFTVLSTTPVPADRKAELNRAFGFNSITETPVIRPNYR